MNGKDFLVLVDTDGAGTFAAVGSQRSAKITETNDVIDTSSKDQRERKVLAGRYQVTVSFDALFVPTDTAFAALKAAMRNGTSIKIRAQESGTPTEEMTAIITDMTREFPDQDASTISLEAAVDGAITTL